MRGLLSALWRRMPGALRRLSVHALASHFTVTAGAVVLDDDGRILLLKHRFRPGSGWGLPGGFVAAREQPEATVERELLEEVGLVVVSAELAFVRTLATVNQVEVFFRCRTQGEAHPRDWEVERAAWFALDELPERLSRDQRALIRRALGDRGVAARRE
jgi:8-oxo-dGTP diphosphatase